MSADNGYILRKNKKHWYCLQMYFASADELPEISKTPTDMQFSTVEEAVLKYGRIAKDNVVEYGLSVDISQVTNDPVICWLCLDTRGLAWTTYNIGVFGAGSWRPSTPGAGSWRPSTPEINFDVRACPVCQT